MAISKILHMGCAKSGFQAKHLANTINYITKDSKTENGLYVSGHNCLPETALKQMLNTKRRYDKMGDARDTISLSHLKRRQIPLIKMLP
ncbi:hypothetical protein LC724_24100 [Blautia sp. RD014234]|nr:hypothetical protein [Blautia parvula]